MAIARSRALTATILLAVFTLLGASFLVIQPAFAGNCSSPFSVDVLSGWPGDPVTFQGTSGWDTLDNVDVLIGGEFVGKPAEDFNRFI